MRPVQRGTALVLAALCAGCAPAPSARPLLLTAEELSATVPDHPGVLRTRLLERTPRLSAGWVEQPSGRVMGLRKNYNAAVRILVFSGRLKVRLGGLEGEAGPGAFISIPRGVQYRLLAAGATPARYVRLVSPDAERETVFETPLPARREAR